MKNMLTEFIGTFFLVLTIGLTVTAGSTFAPLASLAVPGDSHVLDAVAHQADPDPRAQVAETRVEGAAGDRTVRLDQPGADLGTVRDLRHGRRGWPRRPRLRRAGGLSGPAR